ncbi:MAG TPA: HAMP domain-containing sensor histidine kinase, partial [Candidatus Omnitrophota bacterium]|nr:HAMP domain-containing sensor histidine kinase [Candidatus Omnitrophota bacterium]
RNLDSLGHLINDILDYSKLEAGKMKLDLAVSNIDDVIKEACEGLSSWALSKEISLEKNIESGLPSVLIDSRRIIQVLNNLIGNALKFTPKGGKVTISAVSKNNASQIQVAVEDNGVGMEKEDLAMIFERFHQAGSHKQSEMSGTGLGLFISKEIVELHGGKIWAESEKGKGSRFIFLLKR